VLKECYSSLYIGVEFGLSPANVLSEIMAQSFELLGRARFERSVKCLFWLLSTIERASGYSNYWDREELKFPFYFRTTEAL